MRDANHWNKSLRALWNFASDADIKERKCFLSFLWDYQETQKVSFQIFILYKFLLSLSPNPPFLSIYFTLSSIGCDLRFILLKIRNFVVMLRKYFSVFLIKTSRRVDRITRVGIFWVFLVKKSLCCCGQFSWRFHRRCRRPFKQYYIQYIFPYINHPSWKCSCLTPHLSLLYVIYYFLRFLYSSRIF